MKAINTRTKKEFAKVLQIFNKKWWTWIDWDKAGFKTNYWDEHMENTCLSYCDDFIYFSQMRNLSKRDIYPEPFDVISFKRFSQIEKKEGWRQLKKKIDLLIKKVNALEDKVLIKDIEENVNIVWEKNNTYYTPDINWWVRTMQNLNNEVDRHLRNSWLMFNTIEDAEKYIKYQYAKKKIKKELNINT